MIYDFVIADVFTESAFGGNQLAVFPHAEGLSDRAMQALAREINFAETTFVLPPGDPHHLCRVRIFTPNRELPFAGHPTVGTAAVLLHLGKIAPGLSSVVFEEGVGPVLVEIHSGKVPAFTRLVLERAAEAPTDAPDHAAAAAALSLPQTAVLDTWFASAGVPFSFLHLTAKDVVDQARLDRAAWSAHFAQSWAPSLYLFCGEATPDGELYARMFAPAFGIEEDAATGSAGAALAGSLAERLPDRDGTFTWHIDQGVAMGRPSVIETSAEKRNGRVVKLRVGGSSVIVGEGRMNVPDGY